MRGLKICKIEVAAQYNPKELQIDKTIPWSKVNQANQSTTGNAATPKPSGGTGIHLEFTGAEGRSMSVELLFDGYEAGGDTSKSGGKGSVAVAMSINLAGFKGWYQIQGIAAVKAPNAMVAGAEVFMLAATPGSVDDAAVAGEQVLNAAVSTTTGTPSAGLGLIQINRPFLQGQIT